MPKLREFLSGQDDVRLAIVFGSVAQGQAGSHSDLDIALATREPLTPSRQRSLIEELARISGRPVDLVDLSVAGEPLLGQILSSGQRLTGSNTDVA